MSKVTDWQKYAVRLDYRVTYTEMIYARSEEEAAQLAREMTPNGINREALIRPPHTFLEARIVRDFYENPVEVTVETQPIKEKAQ